jgi:mannosyltransferase OCH1-like enzyme
MKELYNHMYDNEDYYEILVKIAKIISYTYNIFSSEKSLNNTNNNIPKLIWQTFKTKEVPPELEIAHNSWITKNPKWKVNLYDDADIEEYIINNWNDRMLKFYKNLTIGAMKADLWRYLILTTHGGVYADLDSVCNKSINTWIYDYDLNDKKDVLLIAIEPQYKYFCQWTILSTPNHPAMRHVSQYILSNYEKNGINTKDPQFVFNTTGPAIWSNAIKNYLKLDHFTAKETYDYYQYSKENREKIENKGIYFLPFYTFSIIYVINQVASTISTNNYQSWRVEEKNMNLKSNAKY